MCFHSRFVEYENCKRPRRNNTQKRENCKLSKCNFHISLQFSYQFAILISVCNSHLSRYGSYVDVCNSYISLQFSYQFAIFISVCNSHVTTPHFLLMWLCWFHVTMTPHNQSATHIRLKQTISPCSTVDQNPEHQKTD
jgi:hypothetical protein